MDPAGHDAATVVPGTVVPYLYTFFAAVDPTFNVGEAAVFEYVNLTWIVTPDNNLSKSAHVTTFAAVAAAVSHVPYNVEPIKPVLPAESVILPTNGIK
jgi:hypothetical protein